MRDFFWYLRNLVIYNDWVRAFVSVAIAMAFVAFIKSEVEVNPVIVNSDAGQPISPTDLADWTPQRVEATFDSGLTVVSSLGQNGNLQYVVKDLNLPVGTVFRVWRGTIVEV